MDNNSTYSMKVHASTRHLAEVRDFVGKHATDFGFGEKQVADIRLAVDEAYTNIIKHSYKNDEKKIVSIELGFKNNKFWISLYDEGQSFDPTQYTLTDIKEKIKNKKRGGFGVYLIKKLMDEVLYDKKDGINEIRMLKTLG